MQTLIYNYLYAISFILQSYFQILYSISMVIHLQGQLAAATAAS